MYTRLSSGCFLGQVLVRRQFEGILLTETRHQQSGWLPTHAHQNAYFCFVRRGEFAERYGSRERLCKPSMLVFHPPEEQHAERIHSQCSTSFNIELEPRWLQWATSYAKSPLEASEVRGGEQTNIALKLQREFAQADSVSPLAVQGLTLELLAGLLRSKPVKKAAPAWLNQVRELLHDQFSERIDWSDLAVAAGVHPVYLVQCFRKHFRATPGEYQRRLRIDWAKEQLQKDDLTLSEIAYQAGFADQSHLTRHFKRQTGLTPQAFRRALAS